MARICLHGSIADLLQQSSLDSSDSQDTDIISESPSRKRQRLDTEAMHVRVDTQTPVLYGDTLKFVPHKDGIIGDFILRSLKALLNSCFFIFSI